MGDEAGPCEKGDECARNFPKCCVERLDGIFLNKEVVWQNALAYYGEAPDGTPRISKMEAATLFHINGALLEENKRLKDEK